jgi:uncharacterized protein
MKLDLKERLQLSFQLRILEKLYPEDQDYYANHRKAIEDGYELHYEWIAENLSDGLSTEDCRFVLDVLDMYASLFFAVNSREDSQVTLEQIKFPGFDGNNETMYMAYTKYFIEDLDRFNEIKETTGGYYNSHTRMIPQYRQMLPKWKEYTTGYNYNLSDEQILDLINTLG